jgi:hypothetical protein
MDEERWAKPQVVDDVTIAFPAHVRELMPSREDCDAALDAMPDKGRKWRELQQRWFFQGLQGAKFKAADGINTDEALRHLSVLQGSFEPKHEHKEAAVAYLMSRWFKDVKVPASAR